MCRQRVKGWRVSVRRRGASHLIISKLVTASHTFMQKRPSSVACAPWIIYSGGWPLAKMDLEFAIKVHSSISPKRIIALLLKSSKAVAFALRPQNTKTLVRSLERTPPGREGTGDRRKRGKDAWTKNENSVGDESTRSPLRERNLQQVGLNFHRKGEYKLHV